jgi:very-short-patch-repair endonuclease
MASVAEQMRAVEADTLAAIFFTRCRQFQVPGWFHREKKIAPPPAPQFVYDLHHEEARVLIELNGGLYMAKGAHNTAESINRDARKVNFAQYMGFASLIFTNIMLDEGKTDPAEVFIPLAEFIKIRMELVRELNEPQIPEGRRGIGVF